jgi:hypothetical protein
MNFMAAMWPGERASVHFWHCAAFSRLAQNVLATKLSGECWFGHLPHAEDSPLVSKQVLMQQVVVEQCTPVPNDKDHAGERACF